MTTNDSMAFQALIEKTQDNDFVRELLSFAAHQLMEWEAEQQCGAGFHEKSSERVTQRNGYRDRTWMTRAGDVDLRIPKLRQGSYLPSFIDPRKTSEKALVAVIQEAYIKKTRFWLRTALVMFFDNSRRHQPIVLPVIANLTGKPKRLLQVDSI